MSLSEVEDPELLRRYAGENSQEAFAELVRRRVDLVYSVALRQVGGDAHLAHDVTQRVFTDLARKARELAARPVLTGWLYRSTQYAASDTVRSERRRRAREQESQRMHDVSTPPNSPAEWEKLRPLLDDAMVDLSDDDRDAVALRFFEGRAFAEIGRTLRLTEDTARKRVERALDKMAAALSRRGVTSTSVALGVVLANQAVGAAPAGLAASITGQALASAAVAAGGAGAIVAWLASAKAVAGAGVAAALVAGGFAWQEHRAGARQADELMALRAERQSAAAETVKLQQQLQAAERRALAAEEDTSRLLAAIQQDAARRATAGATSVTKTTAADSDELTHDAVQARYRRAQELARNGDPATALAELLWCFDRGMPAVSGFGGVRTSFLLSDIARLGERYPAALEALRERRDKAVRRLLASTSDFDAAQTLASINRVLKEESATLAVFDQLPAGDRRRVTLSMVAFEPLREARRYVEALEGTTPSQMRQRLETNLAEAPLPANTTDPQRLRKAQHDYAITTAAKSIEVLAGAGKLPEATTLIERLLSVDASTATRDLLQQHLARAGQPELLTKIGTR